MKRVLRYDLDILYESKIAEFERFCGQFALENFILKPYKSPTLYRRKTTAL